MKKSTIGLILILIGFLIVLISFVQTNLLNAASMLEVISKPSSTLNNAQPIPDKMNGIIR